MATIFDLRQTKQRASLPFITGAANSAGSTIVANIDSQLAKLFEDRNAFLTDGGLITYTGTTVQFSESLKLRINQNIAGAAPYVIDLGSTTRTISASGRMIYAVVNRTGVSATITDDATTLPAAAFANQEVFLIAIRADAGDGTKRLYFRNGTALNEGQTVRLGSSGSGSGGSGTGDDLNTLRFKASFSDDFSENATSNTSAVQSASYTNATYDAAKALYRMSYDASQTGTSTGTAFTLSGTPSFTVAVGDIVYVPSTGEARRVSAVATQTSYTLESAFSANLAAAAVNVSQAVHTTDLRAYTANSTGLSIAASLPSDTVSTYMCWYRDSASSGDAIWDMPASPLVSFVASADNSAWTTAQARQSDLSTEMPIRSVSVSGSNFYLRFFSSASSGTGAVNLLDYKVYIHEDTGASAGATYDMAFCLSSGAGTEYNCSVSSDTGKTRVTTTWSFATGLNSGAAQGQIEVFLNGQKVPRYIDATLTPDASYTEVNANTIELDQDYSGSGLSIEIRKPTPVVDSTNLNSSNITAMQDSWNKGFQGFVDESSKLTAVNGTPSTGQFRSSVIGRASIPDLANDLKARMGIERVMVQQIVELQNEFGSSGERVFGALNDDRGLIRFVGNWRNNISSYGSYVDQTASANTGDYLEIIFYGTGLNWLAPYTPDSSNCQYSVDGGSFANLSLGSWSGVIQNRNYNPNIVVPVVSGLSLGLHTIILKDNAGSGYLPVSGFEILNESSNINVRPGTAFVDGKKLALSAASSTAYNNSFETVLREGASVAFSSTRGARVLAYLKSDGTIGKSAYLTNSAQANLGSASHDYEEVVRTYHPREFGAGRADDLSSLVNSSSNRAFTLDDGTTTIAGQNLRMDSSGSPVEYLRVAAANDFFTITFVGTGLDILRIDSGSGTADTMAVTVNGTSTGSLSTATVTSPTQVKIVSGLPYGTHTVKFLKSVAGTQAVGFIKFIVYQPKKPSLPSGAVELADYNIMADFVANTTSGANTIATGTLRKQISNRENAYVEGGTGTTNWNVSIDPNQIGGFTTNDDRQNAYFEYVFFGTGFEYRGFSHSNRSTSVSVTLNGLAATTANYPSLVSSVYGFTSFASGTLNLTGGVNVYGAGLRISGLPLAVYKVRFTNNNASQFMDPASLDIITPIHSPKSNFQADLQNTLPVGSCAISDNRRLSPVKSESPGKAWAQAFSIQSATLNNITSFIPCPDMSLTIKTNGGSIECYYGAYFYNNTSGADNVFQIYVDGVAVGQQKISANSAGIYQSISDSLIIPVSAGVHKIDLYWKVQGSTIMSMFNRNLRAREF